MITYVPFPSFTRSVIVLSDKHLNVVREGSLEILYTLWKELGQNLHEDVPELMRWKRYEGALIQYARATDEEWRQRQSGLVGVKSVMDWLDLYRDLFPAESWQMPLWFGNADFHRAERELLYAADPVHYKTILTTPTTAR
jgi:hypothetical protein